MLLVHAGRPEDGHCRPDTCQGVKAFDELGKDPQGAPGVGVEKGGPLVALKEAFVFGRIAGGFEQTGLVGPHDHPAASTAVLLRLSRSAVVLSGIVHRSARMPSLRSAMQETPPSGRLGLSVAILLAIAGTIFIGQGMGIIRGSSFMVDDQRWALIGLVMDMAATGIAWVTLRARS